MNKFVFLVSGIVLAVSLSGCVTKVTRVDVDKPIDLSGEWNDYDATLVAQEMIKDCIARPWYTDFMKLSGRNPAVIVGKVANRSHEHINSEVFTKDLERELINSGKVVFVASPTERDQIRDEREDMQRGYTDPATIKAIGKERGADFMLIGSINSIKDQANSKAVYFYQVNLELISLITNDKVWIGQKEIKKKIDHPKASM